MTLSGLVVPLLLGLGSFSSPCVFPLYPGFLAYLSGQSERRQVSPITLGLLVLAGVLVMMLALGVLISTLRVPAGSILLWITPVAYAVVILLGLLLLANQNPFVRLAQIQVPVIDNPYANAFVYGMLYGPIALPCIAPQLVTLLTLSLTLSDFIETLSFFFVFGLGFGIPLFLLSLIGHLQQRRIVSFFTRHYRIGNLIAGALLVGVGLWGLFQEWEAIRLFWELRG